MNFISKPFLAVVFIVCIVLGAFKSGIDTGYNKRSNEVNIELTKQREDYDELKRSKQQAISDIAYAYQLELNSSRTKASDDIARLTADSNRLRVKIRKLEGSTSETASGAGQCADGYAELDSEAAARIIQITQDGDRQIKALQDVIRELNKEETK